jgi:crotonobetainyl-CoA:carnitine CoA-transferase CaiB-like acyl-CoA transferase
MGNENMSAAPSGAFRTADGLLNIAANEQAQFVSLCQAIGRPGLVDDERFAERESRKRNRFALRDLIEEALVSAPAAAWEATLNRAGVPAGRVLSVPEALVEPQVVERSMATTFPAVPGLDRPLTVIRGGFLVDGEPPRPASPPPRLGEHTEGILAEARARAARDRDEG